MKYGYFVSYKYFMQPAIFEKFSVKNKLHWNNMDLLSCSANEIYGSTCDLSIMHSFHLHANNA